VALHARTDDARHQKSSVVSVLSGEPALVGVGRRLGEEEKHVRVITAFNRVLALSGAGAVSVAFIPDGPCGFSTRGVYDRSRRRWRHLELGAGLDPI
jgi:hypothetical protein